MRLLIHDYAGHPFQIQLSRELAQRGHTVLHTFAGELQTPRGELERRDDDPAGFSVLEVAMDRDYSKHKYSFRRRRKLPTAITWQDSLLRGNRMPCFPPTLPPKPRGRLLWPQKNAERGF
jgi:hypothetical protein